MRYDRGWRARRGNGVYDRDYGAANWGGDPWTGEAWLYGPAPYPVWTPWMWPAAPYVPVGYGRLPRYAADYRPRRPPEESETYGRGGDRAVRAWAARHGYDVGYGVEPGRGWVSSGRYDRPLRPRGAYDRGRRYGRDYGW